MAILVAVVGMAAIAVITGMAIGFPTSGSDSSTVQAADSTTVPGKERQKEATIVTTTIVRGSTSLFVTTTTPITTTSTTTTTTTTLPPVPKSKRLKVDPKSVELDWDGSPATITVRTSLERSIGFFVVGVPDGIKASARTGKVTSGKSARISFKIIDRDKAKTATIRIVGSDGADVDVELVVPGPSLAITAVSWVPEKVRCNSSVTLRATVTGSPRSVRALVNVGSSTMSLPMSHQGGTTWQVALPVRSVGTEVSGSVLANDADGAATPKDFSYTVIGGQGC